jgi:hypothetical protein
MPVIKRYEIKLIPTTKIELTEDEYHYLADYAIGERNERDEEDEDLDVWLGKNIDMLADFIYEGHMQQRLPLSDTVRSLLIKLAKQTDCSYKAEILALEKKGKKEKEKVVFS